MGGQVLVNQRFNFWWDAEAGFIHLRAPWKEKHLTPIDVCHKTQMSKELIQRIVSAGTPLAEYLRESYLGPGVHPGIFSYMWDELAAAAIIDPAVITQHEDLFLDMSYLPDGHYGRIVWTSKDMKPWFAETTWKVQTDIDLPRFEKLFVDLMRTPPARAK
jgi:inosine-uridine nucleoside N-ribohydrolase